MNSPELPTPQEEKEIAKLIETNIDFLIERENAINYVTEETDATESETT